MLLENTEATLEKFTKDLAYRIEKGWWPLVIGSRGSGKSYAISQATKSLPGDSPFGIVEVKLARHTVQELFGSEDESGKWNLGIITRYLTPTAKPCVIVLGINLPKFECNCIITPIFALVTPISSSVAHNFSSMFDRGYFQTESNHSFAIPSQVRFVFESSDVESVSSLLLARCSIMHLPEISRDGFEEMSELRGKAAKALISVIDSFPKNDDVQSRRSKMDQLQTLYGTKLHGNIQNTA